MPGAAYAALLLLCFSGSALALDSYARSARENGLWIVVRGDTLFSIARRLLPDNRPAHARIRAALVDLNPDAFGTSAGELRTGAALRLPDELHLERPDAAAGQAEPGAGAALQPPPNAASTSTAAQPQRPSTDPQAAPPQPALVPQVAAQTSVAEVEAIDESSLQTRLSGNVSARYAHFTQLPRFDTQPDNNSAVIGEVEYYIEAESGSSFTFRPYVRAELQDGGDTVFDIREAMYLTFGDEWELRAGIGKVFWGVTESVHLVDIINQTDFLEDVDREEKLGQPMVQASLLRDWGTLEFFLLPYFRVRQLPDSNDRPSFGIDVDNDAAQFESKDAENHLDAALRYSQTFDEVDLGLSYFNGTSRDPRLFLNQNGNALIPFYPLMEQVGLDVQYTSEAWLWKLEAIYRQDDIQSYSAAAGGFEYTFVGIFDSAHDLGAIGEYLYDERGTEATTPFQEDILIGLRWALNDEQSSEALFGVIADLGDGGQSISLEASRRLGDSFKLNLDARSFINTENDPQLDLFSRDDFVRVELGYFF
ncbi:MAG: hypothetical protein OET44_02250 [Gammaproteobacteria bacterium]|nr:hypothetical protein [Gammaproteobacteria bacterium]